MERVAGPCSLRRGVLLKVASVLLGLAFSVGSVCTGLDASTLKPFDQAMLTRVVQTAAHQLMVPGAMVLLRTPQGDFTVGYGTTKLGTANAPTANTYFRAASNTKTMTAAIVVQLAEEGKLRFSDPISKYVADVPNGDRITVSDLLDMRGGLYNFTENTELSETADHNPSKIWTSKELLALGFAHKPLFAPGTEYAYNNTGYVLLGLIIEKVGGQPLAQAMQNRLFRPLGLSHTFLPAADVSAMPEPYSHGYLYGSSAHALAGEPQYAATIKAAARAGTLLPTDYTGLNHSFAGAAGGVVSTADNLATWIEALVSGRVLDGTYQQLWLDSLRPVDSHEPGGQQYGFGISALRWGPNEIIFHGGETPGFNSFMGYDPHSHVTLVVWTNLTLSPEGEATANTIMLKVLDAIYEISPLPAPASTSGSLTAPGFALPLAAPTSGARDSTTRRRSRSVAAASKGQLFADDALERKRIGVDGERSTGDGLLNFGRTVYACKIAAA